MAGNLGLTLILVITIGFTIIGLSDGAKKKGEELKCSRCDNKKNDDECFKNPPEPVSCGEWEDVAYNFVYCDIVFPYGGTQNKNNFARGCLYTKKEYQPHCFLYSYEKPEPLKGVGSDDTVCICSEDGCNKDPFDPDATKWPKPGPFGPGPVTEDPGGKDNNGTEAPGSTGPTQTPGPPGGPSAGDPDGGVGCLQSMSFLIVLIFSLAPFFLFK